MLPSAEEISPVLLNSNIQEQNAAAFFRVSREWGSISLLKLPEPGCYCLVSLL